MNSLLKALTLLATLFGFSQAVLLDYDLIKLNYPNISADSVTNLDFYKGNLTSIQSGVFTKFPNLEKLSISYNPQLTLTSGDGSFDGLSKLKMLGLTNNKMRDLSNSYFASGLENLERLVLNDNEITRLTHKDFIGLKSLKSLYLMINKIEFIEDNTFLELSNLEDLIIANNPFTSIGENTLNGLVSLKKLSIHDGMAFNSKLSSIDRKAFKNLAALKEIQLPYRRFNASYFESFDLNGRKGTYSRPWTAYWELFTIE